MPTEFSIIQAEWYGRLAREGFVDAEDHQVGGFEFCRGRPIPADQGGRPLRKWCISGPEPMSREQDAWSNHPEFHRVLEEICSHGNCSVTPTQLLAIWNDHLEGSTLRQIEKQHGISDNRALVLINRIGEWMSLQDTRADAPESELKPATIVLRKFDPEGDSGFIYASWRNALWFDDKIRDERLAHSFFSKASKAIKAVLAYPTLSVRIACLQDDHNLIVGYSVLVGDHMDWIYVKIDYRNKGIGRLLSRGVKTYSDPQTTIGKAILASHHLSLKENEDGKEEFERGLKA
jgi:hypothetical protein